MLAAMTPDTNNARRRLSMPALFGWLAAFYLIPQIVSLFAVPGIADGPAYVDVRSALQLELVPDLGSALIAMFLIHRLGWVELVRHERFSTRRWVVIVPAAMIVAAVAAIDWTNLADAGGQLVAVLAVSTFFTGVSEELMFRGVALQALRDRGGEVRAAWFSSAMFGLLHLANVIVAGGAAIFQAVWAIGVGYLLYLCRRVGRGIVLPIIVHWLWNFSSFSPELGLDDDAPVISDLQFLMVVLSIVLVVIVLIRRRAIPSTPPASVATTGTEPAGG